MIYFVCCTSRSGSTFLDQLLESTGLLGRPEEYMNHDERSGLPHWAPKLGLAPDTTEREYVPAIIAARSTTNGVFGCKGVPNAYRRLASCVSVDHHIFLRRRDTLRQAISLYRARQSRQWGFYGGQPSQPKNIEFNAPAIHRAEREIHAVNANWQTLFNIHRITPIEAWYEDIEADPAGQVRRIAAAMGIDVPADHRPTARMKRMRDELTEEWVARLHA